MLPRTADLAVLDIEFAAGNEFPVNLNPFSSLIVIFAISVRMHLFNDELSTTRPCLLICLDIGDPIEENSLNHLGRFSLIDAQDVLLAIANREFLCVRR